MTVSDIMLEEDRAETVANLLSSHTAGEGPAHIGLIGEILNMI